MAIAPNQINNKEKWPRTPINTIQFLFLPPNIIGI
jgi:hypothetical protein